MGIFKGYFHIHHSHFDVHETADNPAILSKIDSLHPDLIFLDFSLAHSFLLKDRGEALGKAVKSNNIPICGLRRINANLDSQAKLTIQFDKILDEPLNITDLKNYMQLKFSDNNTFFTEKRGMERRATTDRRIQRSHAINDDLPDTEQHAEQHQSEMCSQSLSGTFKIDHRLKCITLNGKSIELSCKEFLFFEKLASDTGRVFSTDEIIQHLWPEHSNATKADLHQYTHLLRKKIEKNPKDPKLILNVKGFGYRLAAHPVKEKLKSPLSDKVIENQV